MLNAAVNQPTFISERIPGIDLPDYGHAPAVAPDTDSALTLPGMNYLRGFLTAAEQAELLQCVDAEQWMTDLSRRVQHYGWRYDYQQRTVGDEMYLGELPDWLADLAARLHADGHFERPPEQVIVNEYEPGQGIALHADRDCFGPVVATISLGDDWAMRFRPVGNKTKVDDRHLLLKRGSALILNGDARTKWMHGIDKRKTESDGRLRMRRVSLTFRTVIAHATADHESVGG